MMLVKALLNHLSPSGANAKLSVLIFHRVLPEPDPLFPDEINVQRFDQLCGWLASWFNVIALDDAVAHLKSGTLPTRAACITFDDGYADNHAVALPVLQRHGLPATFFIATGFLDGGRMWNDSIIESIRACTLPALNLVELGLGRHDLGSVGARRLAISSLIDQIKYQSIEERVHITDHIGRKAEVQLPHDLMMTSSEVLAMRKAGMQIGAHTISHPILARLTDAQAREQIEGSKRFLEDLLGERVGLFAYPNGKPGEDYTTGTVNVVRSIGFDAAMSTQWGSSRTGDDLFQVRRFTPWDKSRWMFGARLARNLRGTQAISLPV